MTGARNLMNRVMVVDDSRAMRRFLGATLTDMGFEVSEAHDGEQALEALDRDPADLSLMMLDWNMPGINGLEVLRRVRATGSHRDLPIVMVTSEVSPEQMARALLAGADDYVMKPFTGDVVREKLELLGIHP